MIQLKDLSITFHDRKKNPRTILENINLSIARHEAVSIIGPSGSGKSILLKLIAGLLIPTHGKIRVQSNRLSMLFQKNALFDSFSLMENLLLPLEETLGVTGADAQQRALRMLSAVGLAESANLFPDEISGGMQKRLGIARALIIEPEIILYDEPTAGLDPITSRAIADLMVTLHQQNKTTLVMVTNDLQRAYQVSQRIFYCAQKSIQSVGTPAEVKNTSDPIIHQFIYSSALLQPTAKGASL